MTLYIGAFSLFWLNCTRELSYETFSLNKQTYTVVSDVWEQDAFLGTQFRQHLFLYKGKNVFIASQKQSSDWEYVDSMDLRPVILPPSHYESDLEYFKEVWEK